MIEVFEAIPYWPKVRGYKKQNNSIEGNNATGERRDSSKPKPNMRKVPRVSGTLLNKQMRGFYEGLTTVGYKCIKCKK
jgi:hypothetical protein